MLTTKLVQVGAFVARLEISQATFMLTNAEGNSALGTIQVVQNSPVSVKETVKTNATVGTIVSIANNNSYTAWHFQFPITYEQTSDIIQDEYYFTMAYQVLSTVFPPPPPPPPPDLQ